MIGWNKEEEQIYSWVMHRGRPFCLHVSNDTHTKLYILVLVHGSWSGSQSAAEPALPPGMTGGLLKWRHVCWWETRDTNCCLYRSMSVCLSVMLGTNLKTSWIFTHENWETSQMTDEWCFILLFMCVCPNVHWWLQFKNIQQMKVQYEHACAIVFTPFDLMLEVCGPDRDKLH